MTRRKKGENIDNNKPEEASTKAMDTSKHKKDSNASVGDIQEMFKPPVGLQAPSNSPQHVVDKKGETDDDGKAEDAVYVTTHLVNKVASNASEKMTIKDSDNSTCDNQVEGSSNKKRKRRRGKSTLDNSGSEPVLSAEHGAHKSNSSKRAFEKDTDRKLECDNKALDYIEEIAQRISEIESKSDESRTFITKPKVVKKRCSPSEKGKREIIFCTKEEKRRVFPNDRYVSPIIRFKDSEINIPLRPVIIVTDKATQTDPALDPSSISKLTDGKNSTVQKSNSDTSVKPKQKESTIQFLVEEKPENASELTDTIQDKIVSCSNASSRVETLQNITSSKTLTSTEPKTEPPSISESTDCKISTTVKSDSDGSVVNKPNKSTLRFPDEEMQPENVSKDTSTFQNKNESFSNLRSSVKTLQSLTSTRSSKSTEPEPPSISKSTDDKNSASLKSDSDSTVATKPIASALHFPAEEIKLENVSEGAATVQNKIDSLFNMDLPEETLQSMTDEFLRNLKIISKDFEEGFIKSLKRSK